MGFETMRYERERSERERKSESQRMEEAKETTRNSHEAGIDEGAEAAEAYRRTMDWLYESRAPLEEGDSRAESMWQRKNSSQDPLESAISNGFRKGRAAAIIPKLLDSMYSTIEYTADARYADVLTTTTMSEGLLEDIALQEGEITLSLEKSMLYDTIKDTHPSAEGFMEAIGRDNIGVKSAYNARADTSLVRTIARAVDEVYE